MMTSSHWVRRVVKPLVFVACLVPFALLVADLTGNRLGPNPAEDITHRTGDATLFLLLATLSVTPIRRLTGVGAVVQLRRMLGLFAFFYAALHFSTFVVFDHFFDLAAMLEDVVKRPYITIGFTSFVLLIPLAVTSTKGWVKRLGGRRWKRLHQLVYVAAGGGVLHYLWLVKADVRRPTVFAIVLVLLLVARLQPRSKIRHRRPQIRSDPLTAPATAGAEESV